MMRSRGYTIIEALMAILILAIVIPGLTAMVVSSRQSQVTTLRFENAAAFALQVVDSLERLPPSRIPANGSATTTVGGKEYEASWLRTDDALGGAKLLVTVRWTVGGKTHSASFKGALR